MLNMLHAVIHRTQKSIDVSNRRVDQCSKLSEKSDEDLIVEVTR